MHTALDLGSAAQLEALTEEISKRANNVVASDARGADLLQTIRETILPCVEHVMAASVLSPSDVNKLQMRLNRAYRHALGTGISTSGAMLTLPENLFGFGLQPLQELYLIVTNRVMCRVVNDTGIPGQLARALLDRQLQRHGNTLESIEAAPWPDLQCPWLRKIKMLLSSGTGMRPDFPTLGGTPDNILPLLRARDKAKKSTATDHISHLRHLWAASMTLRNSLCLAPPRSTR